jgi:8-oxo-dGTP diphosphatase
MTQSIKIGCEAYIIRDGLILLGKRGKVHGQGTWAFPGGHLEFVERSDDAIRRELIEETGMHLPASQIKFLALTDDLDPEAGSHYVHITFAVSIGDQEPQLLEPQACSEWRWFPSNALPKPIYPPHAKILSVIAQGTPYEAEF